MNNIYEKFCKGFKNNQCIFVKRKPNTYEIHVVILSKNFETWEQLKRLNELLDLHNLAGCWHKFI